MPRWVIGVLVACVLGLGVAFLKPSPTLFLDNFSYLLLAGLGVAAYAGFETYSSHRPKHHQSHAGAAVIVWAGGACLLGIVLYLATLIVAVGDCVAISAVGPPKDVTTAAGWFLKECNSEELRPYLRLYMALSPWQTGIGAGIGLFGVAWSAMYRSVYEDWRKYDPPSFSDRDVEH